MKKHWIVCGLLFILLVFSISNPTYAEEEINDLDEQHWAYESVTYLIENGYMDLYADDTFRGEESISRYTLADILHNLLTDEEFATLLKVSTEYREDLVDLNTDVESIKQEQEEIKDLNAVLQLRQSSLQDEVSSFDSSIEELLDSIKDEQELRQEMDTAYSSQITESEQEINELNDELSSIQTELNQLAARIIDVEKLASDQAEDDDDQYLERIRALERKIESFQRQLADNQNFQEEEPKTIDEEQSTMMYAVGAVLLLLLIG